MFVVSFDLLVLVSRCDFGTKEFCLTSVRPVASRPPAGAELHGALMAPSVSL